MKNPYYEIEVAASLDNLQQVLSFLEEKLEAAECPMKVLMQITVAAEEIFVNIATTPMRPTRVWPR